MSHTNARLSCDLKVTTLSDGAIALAFSVQNLGRQPVTVQYFKPFIGFDLSVLSGDELVRVTQPAYDVPVQPQAVTIAPGETAVIDTPIHLRFAANSEGNSGQEASQPTLWTLEHAPTPVLLRVLLHLEGAGVSPCVMLYDPDRAHGNS